MTNQEAIERLKVLIDTLEGMISYCKDFEPKNDTSRYERDIECYKMAIDALEKQEAKDSPHKEPISVNAFDGVKRVLTYKCVSCPTCGKWLSIHGYGKGYCQYCGQAVKNNFYNEQE